MDYEDDIFIEDRILVFPRAAMRSLLDDQDNLPISLFPGERPLVRCYKDIWLT